MISLPLPKTISEQKESANRSLFTIEPLYPGYGMTVANALRRVLLSSLTGAAVTAVKIDGATHEFSSLPHVKQDMVDIILNLKKIRFKVHGEGPWVAKLHVTGAKDVTAGDIDVTSDLEVINTDQPIATLTDKAGSLSMELMVGVGRGYVPVENREKEKLDIGTIAIDAVYTPVKNVNFTTEHVRVEQITNYDKLVLDISTDGTITPAEALSQANEILVQHFDFIKSGPAAAEEVASEPVAVDEPTDAMIAEVAAEEKPKRKATKKKKTEDE